MIRGYVHPVYGNQPPNGCSACSDGRGGWVDFVRIGGQLVRCQNCARGGFFAYFDARVESHHAKAQAEANLNTGWRKLLR